MVVLSDFAGLYHQIPAKGGFDGIWMVISGGYHGSIMGSRILVKQEDPPSPAPSMDGIPTVNPYDNR